jgi:hypothetical protein
MFAITREKRSLIFYREMKLEWGEVQFSVCHTGHETRGLAWFKTDIWKFRGARTGSEKRRCPLSREEEDVTHVLFKYS